MTVIQTNLQGKTIQPTNKSEPWKSVGCCEACYNATGKRCVCKCKGVFHGLGNSKNHSVNKIEQEKPYSQTFSFYMPKKVKQETG